MNDNPENDRRETRAKALRGLKDRALDTAAEGIAISDLSARDNQLIYVNSGFERLTGYKAEEVLGRNCRFLQGPETDPATAEKISQALHDRSECTVEILNYRKDGTTFWNRLSLTPVCYESDSVTHYIGVQSDVTARRAAEDALRTANSNIRAGLQAGAKIQQALLPSSPPEIPGATIRWRFQPCEELAGDIFNVFHLKDGKLVVYLLDVVGHGVPAALLSVTLSRVLSPEVQKLSPEDKGEETLAAFESPLSVANRLNRQFPFDLEKRQFFTMLYGVLDVPGRVFRYVSAGHPPIIHADASGQARILKSAGLPVGIEASPGYEEQEVSLQAGERLFLYTDGLPEAMDAGDVAFGTERLLQALSAPGVALDEILASAMKAVRQWTGNKGLTDDASIVGIESTDL